MTATTTAKRKAGKWNPAHHPRDARGRFTKSATRVLKGSDGARARSAIQGFKPVNAGGVGPGGSADTLNRLGAGGDPDEAMREYLAGGWKTENPRLRTEKNAAVDPRTGALDKSFTPTTDDVLIERRVPLSMFSHIPIDQLEGMKVRDAAPAAGLLDGSAGEAPDGMVTMHIAAPAGTHAYVAAEMGAIVLARDTEVAVSKAVPNGRGGWDLYGVVIPRQGAEKPARGRGKGDQAGAGDPPGGPVDDAPDLPGEGDQDTTPAGDTTSTAGTRAPRARKAAAKPAQDDQDSADAGDQDTGDGNLTTDPVHVLSHSINAAAKDGGGVRSFAQPDGTVRVVARSVTDGRTAYERGAAHMRRTFPDIDVPDRYEVRVRNTADRHPDKATGGYKDERTGDIVVPLTADDQGVQDLSPGKPAGAKISPEDAYRKMHGDAAGDAKFGKRKPDEGSTPRPAGEDDDQAGADAAAAVEIDVADLEAGAYVHLAGVDQYGKATKATGYAGRPTPVTMRRKGSKAAGEQMLAVSMSETPNGAGGWRMTVYTSPDASAELRPEPADTARLRGTPDVAEPAAPAVDEPPAGSKLAELSPVDRAALAVAVEEHGPGIFQSPLTGRSFSDVGRYVSEGSRYVSEGSLSHFEDKYGRDTIWRAAEEYARSHPDVLARTHHEVVRARQLRALAASDHAKAAAAATKAGDFAAARAAIDAGELVDPTHRESMRGWDEMRAIVARVEAKHAPLAPAKTDRPNPEDDPEGYARALSEDELQKAAATRGMPASVKTAVKAEQARRNEQDATAGDQDSTAGTSAPDVEPTRKTLAEHGTPTRGIWHGSARAPKKTGVPVRIDTQADGSYRVLSADGKINQRHAAASKVWLAPAGDDQADIPEAPAAGAGGTVAELQRNQYVTVSGTSTQEGRGPRTATGYVGATTPTGGDTMVTLTEYPNGAGQRTLILARPDAETTPAERPASPDVVLWKDARTGRPVANPGQTAIVRRDVVRDPDREAAVAAAIAELDADPDAGEVSPLGEDLDQPPPDVTTPADPAALAAAAAGTPAVGDAVLVKLDDAPDERPGTVVGMVGSQYEVRLTGGSRMGVIVPPSRVRKSPAAASTAGTSAPVSLPEPRRPRVGDRPPADPAALLANPTVTPHPYVKNEQISTWPAELSAPKVAETIHVDGRDIAIVQLAEINQPNNANPAELRYSQRFYAIAADAEFTPMAMTHTTTATPSRAAGDSNGRATAHPGGNWNTHIASSLTLKGARDGATRILEDRAARDRFADVARRNIGAHSPDEFNALDPAARIEVGDLVAIYSHKKYRTAVVTKTTPTKVSAIAATPSNPEHPNGITASKGTGARLLQRRQDVNTPAAAAVDEPSTAGTSTPDGPPQWTRTAAGGHTARTMIGDREVTISINRMNDQGYVGKWSVSAIDDGDRVRLDAGDIFPKDSLADAKAEVDRWLSNERREVEERDRQRLDDAALAQRLIDAGLVQRGTVTAPPADPPSAEINPPRPIPDQATADRLRVALDDPDHNMGRGRTNTDLWRNGWVDDDGFLSDAGRAALADYDTRTAGTSAPAGTGQPVVDPDVRRAEIAGSMVAKKVEELAESVDAAVDAAKPDDPAEARKAALEAKRAELDKANAALAAHPASWGGFRRGKQALQRADANLKRSAALVRDVQRLEQEVKALERPPAPSVPAGGFTPDQLKGARIIRTRVGWHEVVKVNAKTVKVKAAPGMDDLVPVKRIIDARDTDGRRVDAPAVDVPAAEQVDAPSTADTSAPETTPDAPETPAAAPATPEAPATPAAPEAPARPVLDKAEEGPAVAGRVFAQGRLRGEPVAYDDTRFRMRRARVGNRELDLYDNDGNLLGAMHEQPGDRVTVWITRPADGRAGVTVDDFPAAVKSLRAGEIHPEATPARPPVEARVIRNAEQAREAMLDSLGKIIANPDARISDSADQDTSGRLQDAGFIFMGRITNRGLAHYQAERGEGATRDAARSSTAGTATPAAPARQPYQSITRQADPFALAGGGSADDDLFSTPTPAAAPAAAAPAVDTSRIAADDQVRVAGQWATVTAVVDGGQLRVRFPGDRLATISAGDVREHRPAQREDDLFGGGRSFVPGARSDIGAADRADVGRTRGQQAVQQASMFDVADQVQIEGQTALLDSLLQMPAAEPPAAHAPILAPDAPEPERVDVPEDLTGWSDEQLAGLFADVSGQADYDEAGTDRIMAEWDRRESEMNALLGMVPEDLTTLEHDQVADLFAEVTSHHGTMDTDQVARLEAELDRRDREHVAALADVEGKRALVAKAPADYADDDELAAAMAAAADLDDEEATNRILAEWDRREQTAAAEQARQAEADRQTAIVEAEAATARAAVDHAAAERRSLEQQTTIARQAGALPRMGSSRAKQAAIMLGPERLRELVGEDTALEAENAVFNLSEDDKARIVFAALGIEAEREFAGMSDEDLIKVISTGLFGRGNPEDQARAARASRERSRRDLVAREAEDTELLGTYRQEILYADAAKLTDADLAAAPALIGAMYGPDGETAFQVRLPQITAEAERRQRAAADVEARKATGPAGPARLVNPIGALAEVEMMASRNGSGFGFRGAEAAERLKRAKRAVYGLDQDATDSAIKAAARKDPRGLPEQSAMILAWYRHIGEIELADDKDQRAISGWMRGPADDADYREVIPSLPPATVAKAPDVWEAMKAQAVKDLQAGDKSGAVRYTQAKARAYGIWFDPDATTDDDMRALQGRMGYVENRDPRTDQQKYAAYIAEWRRLADATGVDPADSLRYGPQEKTAKRPKARGTWRESTPAQEEQINDLVAKGREWVDAYAEVHNLDVADLRREEAAYLAKSTAIGTGSAAKAYRQHYDELVYSNYLGAEEGTRGNLLNAAGKAEKIDPITLFSGPSARANKYASEELKRWWGEHPPPRMTFAQYKQMVQGDAGGATAGALQGAKGNEFA